MSYLLNLPGTAFDTARDFSVGLLLINDPLKYIFALQYQHSACFSL